MAHYQQIKFVSELADNLPDYFSNKKVLEIGSWDVNGSVRSFFKNCEYVGADVAAGPGVDLVCRGEAIQLPDASFDVVISCECFEHNAAWQATFRNMLRLLKPGGLCVITCATLGRSEHGTKRTNPGASLTALENFPDYYKNLTPADFKRAVDLPEFFSEYFFTLNKFSKDLYFVGILNSQMSSNTKAQIDSRLIERVRAIKREKRTNYMRQINITTKFFYRYALATLLGESSYHNFMYKLSRRKSN
ncbi:MAG: hypothetical protein JWM78_2522 [Verrucomicrobiaceae bacterium]|nr:hypothetical protein [Verrucomicrobiaceae bacterium]